MKLPFHSFLLNMYVYICVCMYIYVGIYIHIYGCMVKQIGNLSQNKKYILFS